MLICASKCHDIPESRGLASASSFMELMRPQKTSLIRLPVLIDPISASLSLASAFLRPQKGGARNISHLGSFSWWAVASGFEEPTLFWAKHLGFGFLPHRCAVQCPYLRLKPPRDLALRTWLNSGSILRRRAGRDTLRDLLCDWYLIPRRKDTIILLSRETGQLFTSLTTNVLKLVQKS